MFVLPLCTLTPCVCLCRSIEREAHYVDLEAQPTTGAGQADLRHLLPSDTASDTLDDTTAAVSESQPIASTASTASTALDPAANAPSSSKPAKAAKPAKKQAKPEATASVAPVSLQDTAESIVQQVQLAVLFALVLMGGCCISWLFDKVCSSPDQSEDVQVLYQIF